VKRLAILIPAYNEEKSLPALIHSLKTLGLPDSEIVVINDGSRDSTLEVARKQSVTVLDLPINLGIGGAMQTGYRWAEKMDYEWAIQMDGDGQHDPGFIVGMLQEAERSKVQMLIGSRFLPGHSSDFRSTFLRRVGIGWFSFLIGALCRKRVYDPTSGLRLVRRELIRSFAHSYPSDYPEPETTATAIAAGHVVREVPVSMRARQGGRSSIDGPRSLYYMVKVSVGILMGVLLGFEQRIRGQVSTL